jgi:acetyl-CoA carboxylase/biotin carboxylase 1
MSSRTPSADILKELTDSQHTVYDVLPSFFNHQDPLVVFGMYPLRSDDVSFQFILVEAAFEVYIRRAYRAYSLLSIDYEEGDGLDDGEVPNVIIWRFNLGQSHTPPLTPRTE